MEANCVFICFYVFTNVQSLMLQGIQLEYKTEMYHLDDWIVSEAEPKCIIHLMELYLIDNLIVV